MIGMDNWDGGGRGQETGTALACKPCCAQQMTLGNKLEFGPCCAWAKGGTFSTEQTPLVPSQAEAQQEGVCRKGMDPLLHSTMSKAVLTPCLQRQRICGCPGVASGLGGAGGCLSVCLSVHPLPPHEPELATVPFGSSIPCSSKCRANGEAAARGTLCSAAAHSINLMRIFFFFFTRQMVK